MLRVIVSMRRQIAMLMHLTATALRPKVTARLWNETGLLRIAQPFHLVRDSMQRTLTTGSRTEAGLLWTANMLRQTETMMPPIVTSLGSMFTNEPRIEAKLPVTVNPLPWIGNSRSLIEAGLKQRPSSGAPIEVTPPSIANGRRLTVNTPSLTGSPPVGPMRTCRST
jgi:hypothetical protein